MDDFGLEPPPTYDDGQNNDGLHKADVSTALKNKIKLLMSGVKRWEMLTKLNFYSFGLIHFIWFAITDIYKISEIYANRLVT